MRQIGTLNMSIAGRTIHEYQRENKEQINENNRRYYNNHQEQMKTRHKEYYERNKELISERNKNRYLEKREAIRMKENEKIKCECGCMISRGNFSEHKKTAKHDMLMSKIAN